MQKKYILGWILTMIVFLTSCGLLENKEVNNGGDFETISFLEGFTDRKVSDENSAIQAIDTVSEQLGITDATRELKVADVNTIGTDRYYRMQQYYNDIPIYGKTVILSADEEGNATALAANSIKVPKDVSSKPSVSEKDIIKEIKGRLQEEEEEEDVTNIKIEINKSENLFYYEIENSDIILAYVVPVGMCEFVIDAKSGKIVNETKTVMEDSVERCFNADGTESFEGYYFDDISKYVAYNQERNIMIYSYLGQDSEKVLYNVRLESSDNYFGNVVNGDKTEKKQEFEKGVTLINNVSKVYDYYNTRFLDKAYGELISCYNDGYDSGKNARGGSTADGKGYVSFGTKTGVENIDTIAHEYTHVVTSHNVNWAFKPAWGSQPDETGAISEAYSDIFGEIIEANIRGKAPDWKHDDRIISDPMRKNYPAKIGDKQYEEYEKSKWGMFVKDTMGVKYYTDYSHGFSTIISHAAYLMWNGIDGTQVQKIDTETLAELWYRALQFLNSDATFEQCANSVILAAQQMYQDNSNRFSLQQLGCVKKAFERVGIISDIEARSSVVNGATIYAIDITKQKAYDNYHLFIEEIDISTRKEEIVVETDIVDENGYKVDLDEGIYRVTVTDNADNGSKYEYSTIIDVIELPIKKEETQKVYIYTDFKSKIAATDFKIPVERIITLGEVSIIEPEIIPADADDYEIKWYSSDEKVARISKVGKMGIVRSHSKGMATITAELISKNKTITRTTNLRVASQGRDTVLVLDVSGSMDGIPMAEMKKAATDFCRKLLQDEYNNRVGIVFYDDEIHTIDLTNDLNSLIAHIENVSDGGMTNMEGAIATAKEMLDIQGAADSIKNIVVMADGLPNDGKISDSGSMQTNFTSYSTDTLYANAVIDTAKKAMQSYNMYSLGFFHDLAGDTFSFATELMKQLTNKQDGYHQVDKAENLQFAFGDISEEISDGSKIIINIACPVDVLITYNGETISSAKENYNDTTSFGTLQLLGSAQDIKVLSLNADIEYDIQILGTGVGEMNYSVNYLNENGDMTDSREFAAVPITPTVKITSNTNNSTEKMDLNIDEDGDGNIDVIWSAERNGKGEITYGNMPEPVEEVVEEEPIEEKSGLEIWQAVLIVISVLIVCGLIVILIVVLGKDRKESDEIPILEEEKNIIEKRIANEKQSEERTEDKEVVSQAAVIILSGPLAGAEIPLSEHKVIYIGKDGQKANVVFSGDFPNVSRLHCSITYEDKFKKYFVTDCSTNGTFYTKTKERFVKGKRTPVCMGTVISLGSDKAMIQLK